MSRRNGFNGVELGRWRIPTLLRQSVRRLVYLLFDDFSVDDDAPVASPRASGLVVTDTGNKLSVSGGKLVKTGGTFKLVSPAYPRAAGLAFYVRGKITTTGGTANFGLSEDGTNVADGIMPANALITIYDDTIGVYWVGDLAGLIDAVHDYLVVARSAGAFIFIRGGRYGKWNLLSAPNRSNGANLQWLYKNISATDSGTLDDAEVIQLAGTASDFWAASYHSATPSDPVSCTASRSAMVDFTWTPGAGETMEIYARQVDASNRMILRCNQAGSTFALIRVTAGIETVMQSVAQTWTVGTPYKIWLMASPTHVWQAYINQTIKLAPGTSLVNEFGTGFGAAGFATGSDFAVYPLGVTSLPSPFDFDGFRWFLGYGDSKTYAGKYQAYLCDKLEVSTGNRWCFENIGRSGYTVATMAATIATDLALQTETPEHVFINLGTNDVSSLPAEATWKANYRIIIEAIHAKWASAKIYLAKPVRLSAAPPSTPLAAVATMHGYIDGLVGEYDYVYPGLDETELEGGDGYTTYFADALHPNDAGYNLSADKWTTAAGL